MTPQTQMQSLKYFLLFAELNEFMMLVDARLARMEPHPVGLVAKVRKAGSPSKTPPPVNAPVWCVNPTCTITQFAFHWTVTHGDGVPH